MAPSNGTTSIAPCNGTLVPRPIRQSGSSPSPLLEVGTPIAIAIWESWGIAVVFFYHFSLDSLEKQIISRRIPKACRKKTINRNPLVLVAADHLQKISSMLNCQDFPLPPVLRAPTVSVVVRGFQVQEPLEVFWIFGGWIHLCKSKHQFGVDDATEVSHSSTPLLYSL